MFRLLRVATQARPIAATQPLRTMATRSSAALGGQAHHHGHENTPRGPYDPYHPPHDEHSDGHHSGGHHGPKDPNLPRGTLYAVYAVYLFVGWAIAKRMMEFNPIDDWARREALAREQVRLAGGVVEFGKYYQEDDGGSNEMYAKQEDYETSYTFDSSGGFRRTKTQINK